MTQTTELDLRKGEKYVVELTHDASVIASEAEYLGEADGRYIFSWKSRTTEYALIDKTLAVIAPENVVKHDFDSRVSVPFGDKKFLKRKGFEVSKLLKILED